MKVGSEMQLRLYGTKVTGAGVKKFKLALPQCQVYR